MALASMTGFATAAGSVAGFQAKWDVKSVNAKGLDVRVRVPGLLDGFDLAVRKHITGRLGRGSVTANLSLGRQGAGDDPFGLDDAKIAIAASRLKALAQANHIAEPGLIDILTWRGLDAGALGDFAEPAARAKAEQALLGLLDEALDGLIAARAQEGGALVQILSDQAANLRVLIEQADACDGARAEALRDRLKARLAELLENTDAPLDEARLEQEVAHMAIKMDVREELDRLRTHITALEGHLAAEGPVGRTLDFLMQEFNREANTLCSKSGDKALTAIGLEMKTLIDRMREQCLNLE